MPSWFRIASSIATLPSIELTNKELPQSSSENFVVALLCLQHRSDFAAQPTFYLTDVRAHGSFAQAVFTTEAPTKLSLASSSQAYLQITLPPRNSTGEESSCQKDEATAFIYRNHEMSARVDSLGKNHEAIQPEIVVQVVASGQQSSSETHGKDITVVYQTSGVSYCKEDIFFSFNWSCP